MNTNHLLYFLKVYEKKSFSRAADSLYVTPQGVSKAILKLEDTLRCSLFYRTPKGLVPTEYAHLLHPRALAIIEELSAVDLDFKNLSQTFDKEIWIGATLGTYQSLGEDFGDRLRRAIPERSLHFEDPWDLQCEKNVLSGDFDLALTAGPMDSAQFNVVKLRTSPMCALVGQDHPLAEKNVVSISDLEPFPLLLTSDLFRSHHMILDICMEKGFTPNLHSATLFSESLFKKSSVPDLVGITVERFLMDQYPKTHIVIPFDLSEISWELLLITKKQKNTPPIINRIVAEIVALAMTNEHSNFDY